MKVNNFMQDLPTRFELNAKFGDESGKSWATRHATDFRNGINRIQMTLVQLMAERIDKLPMQLEAGIRAASKSTVDEVTASFQATMSKPTMAEVIKRNPNVLILQPVGEGVQNPCR